MPQFSLYYCVCFWHSISSFHLLYWKTSLIRIDFFPKTPARWSSLQLNLEPHEPSQLCSCNFSEKKWQHSSLRDLMQRAWWAKYTYKCSWKSYSIICIWVYISYLACVSSTTKYHLTQDSPRSSKLSWEWARRKGSTGRLLQKQQQFAHWVVLYGCTLLHLIASIFFFIILVRIYKCRRKGKSPSIK